MRTTVARSVLLLGVLAGALACAPSATSDPAPDDQGPGPAGGGGSPRPGGGPSPASPPPAVPSPSPSSDADASVPSGRPRDASPGPDARPPLTAGTTDAAPPPAPLDAARDGAGAAPADAAGSANPATHPVFGTDRLHQITITLDPTGYARIFTDKVECDPARNDQRFAADVTFDGVALTRVGARRKGNWGSINAARPAFSLKFNWDPGRKDQRLFGLDKLTLNNGVQDRGLLSEHMTYEIARNGGIAAPLTSHALVTVNGVVRGIYIIKESIDGDFLGRSFGAGNKSGNLYEGEWLRDECGGVKPEFLRAAEDPKVMRAMDLKDEAEEMRTRADLLGAIDAVRKTSTSANGGDTWIAEVGKHIDLSQFITFFAVEALTNHTDGYIVLANNYFIYRRPDLQRFQFIHHGADRGFDVVERIDPLAPTLSEAPNLARYVFQLPKTRELYKAELTRLIKLWDTALLTARVAAVARAFMPLRGRTEPVVVSDLRRFDRVRPNVEGLIRERKALVVR